MQGAAEDRQKLEATPESIRLGNTRAQASVGTKLDAFNFYIGPGFQFFRILLDFRDKISSQISYA
jgi:hypothetical protein